MQINVDEVNFHPLLKDIENMFWFFLISVRALSDYDVQNILHAKDSTQKDYFPFLQMLNKFNTSTNLKIERKGSSFASKLNIAGEMIFVGKAMAIFLYEVLVRSNYFMNIKDFEEFKFLKHIRNGAAHNNKFDFKYHYGRKNGQWIINNDEIIKWNNLEISKSLQDKTVFNEFISIADVFLLAKHFSELLIKIDDAAK